MIAVVFLCLLVCLVYYCSNTENSDYDYTLRIAGAFLDGNFGLSSPPPPWLNEFVPVNGMYYSVFPLGSVVTMTPFALLDKLHITEGFSSRYLVGFLAGAATLLTYLIAGNYTLTFRKRLFLALLIPLGTWMWANLAFGGAWQIALGFAVIGQLGALYFTLVKRSPLLAGAFFALAFGNRTEVLLTAPIYVYFLLNTPQLNEVKRLLRKKETWIALVLFCSVPAIMGLSTLGYNYVRFSSPFDFGYAKIPGVLEEPWYADGIFALSAVPRNFNTMIVQSWRYVDRPPYFLPNGFGESILLTSPFLFLLFRRGKKGKRIVTASWIAIVFLTATLWVHGNTGGWQYSYRYAMILIPWILIILLEKSPKKLTKMEILLFTVSIIINAYGTYIFLWTDLV